MARMRPIARSDSEVLPKNKGRIEIRAGEDHPVLPLSFDENPSNQPDSFFAAAGSSINRNVLYLSGGRKSSGRNPSLCLIEIVLAKDETGYPFVR